MPRDLLEKEPVDLLAGPRDLLAGRDLLPEKQPSKIGHQARGAWETVKNIGRVYPALETAATLATQLYGLPAAGYAGLAGTIIGGPQKGEEWINKTAGALIYQPQTRRGQELTETTMSPVALYEKGAEKAGEATYEATESPTLATGVHTAIMGAPMALVPALRRGRTGKPTVKPAVKPKEVARQIETDLTRKQFQDQFIKKPEPRDLLAEIKKKEITGDTKISEKISRTEAGKMIAEGDVAVIPHLKEGMQKHGQYPMLDAINNEVNRLVHTAKTPEQGRLIMENYKKLKPEIDKVLKGEPPATTLYSGLPINKAIELHKQVGEKVWDDWVMKKTPELLEKVPGGKAVNRALIYDYRGNLPGTPEYMKTLEGMHKGKAVGREYAVDLGTRLQRFPEQSQIRMGEFIRGEKKVLPAQELAVAQEAKNAMLELGKQAVDSGLLSEETFFKNAGKYMPRLYTSKEYQSLLTRFGQKKPARLDLSRFKKRKEIPKEIREEMGEILTPGYPIAKGIAQLTHDIETARFFNTVAKNPEWSLPKGIEAPIPEGWKQLPSNKKLGKLSESHVHPEIFADLQETIRVMGTPERVWRKALGSWKFGKVIMSPKTHARNVMSNSILAHLGGMSMYEQPIYLSRAIKAMRGKDKYWQQAKQEGLMRETFTNAELRSLFDRVEGQMSGIKAQSMPEKFGKIGEAWEKSKTGLRKAAKLYEAEEQWFKMAKYIHNVERKKMSPAAAAADAEKWLFNYSKLTKFQEKYRTKWYGAPFATFTFKAIPRIAEAAVKTPWRFALPGAMIYALEEAARKKIGDTWEQAKAKRELLPEWMQGQMMGMPNFARVPIVDDNGREYYLNLTYILPWGDLAESGGFGPIPGGLMPMSQPFVKEPMSQIMNYDPFWEEEIVPDSALAGKTPKEKLKTSAALRAKHAATTLVPTPAIDVSKGIAAFRGQPDYRGRTKPKGVVAADVFGGIKMYPVDYAEQAARLINEKNPQKGWMAKKLESQIKSLVVKKQAMEKSGGDTATYDKMIEEKIQQIKGLAEETRKASESFRKTKGEPK